jgi:hypothetical protein
MIPVVRAGLRSGSRAWEEKRSAASGEDAERGGAYGSKRGGEPPHSKGKPKSTVPPKLRANRSDCATFG